MASALPTAAQQFIDSDPALPLGVPSKIAPQNIDSGLVSNTSDYQQIRDIANIDWTVLIEGETGTGKELAARALHYASHRRDQPFISVNCAGLTDSLIGSQLFGHKRGAFTGAVEDHLGYFEAGQKRV